MSTDIRSIHRTTGTSKMDETQLDRIERKLDQLIAALAEDEPEEEKEAVTMAVTLDGQRHSLLRGDGFL